MDIVKYIGQFLSKNYYCSLPGLGVFELNKKPAGIRNGDSSSVNPPTFQVSFKPVGSIDDSFASFCASQENVSISNASNNIKQYCIEVKQALQEHGHYDMSPLGKFVFKNNVIEFEYSGQLDFASHSVPLPELKVKTDAGAKLDFNYPPSHRRSETGSNAIKYIGVIVLIAVLLSLVYFIFDYYRNNSSVDTPIVSESTTPVENNSSVGVVTTDSAGSSMSVAPSVSTATPGAWLVVINEYSTQAAADAKAKKLSSYGNVSKVIPTADNRFLVALEAMHPSNDTTALVDSLRRFFNPKGKLYIYK